MKSKIEVIAEVIKSGKHIGHLATSLGISVAEASRLVAHLSEQHPKLAAALKDFPKNINNGYIFLGDHRGEKFRTVGEQNNKLKIGQHVLAKEIKKLPRSVIYEIFEPIAAKEVKFDVLRFTYKGLKEHGEFKKLCEVWIPVGTNEDRKRDILKAAGGTRMISFGEERINYKKGHWLGTVNGRALTSVN